MSVSMIKHRRSTLFKPIRNDFDISRKAVD